MALPVAVRRAVSAAGRESGVILCRTLASLGIASTILWTSGCYSYAVRPVSEVSQNAIVTADINDVGRVALGDRAGPEVLRVEGKVVQRSDSSMRLLVSQVSYLNGDTQEWQGQELALRAQDVKVVSQRTFSRSRTALLIGAIVVGFVATVLTLNFLGITNGDTNRDKGGDPPPES
ncbi:MAG TPA: hypothetical protein VM053_06985 [Gemmatimonadaceae bacterium]|nr:hypothetical protein [Gemmatimonadaceae bacterium]